MVDCRICELHAKNPAFLLYIDSGTIHHCYIYVYLGVDNFILLCLC